MSLNWEGKVGDAFFRFDGLKEHLYIVLYDPDHYPELGYGTRLCIVSVNFTSVKNGKDYDPACIIQSGEHPFIKHDSYVKYNKLEIGDYEHIIKCVNYGPWRPAESVSDALLIKMQNGVFTSGETAKKYKKYLKK